jgi:hypothetical protein
MNTQLGLFTDFPAAPAVASGIGAVHTEPGIGEAALTGDGYGWLAKLLPVPAAPTCKRCGVVMVLPGTALVLWTCPTCHPQETL